MRSTTRPEYQRFLNRLIEIRNERGLDQQTVAKKLKMQQSYVSRCETGGRRIDIVEAAQFARLYKVSLDELVGL